MVNEVNPPPVIKIPDEFSGNRNLRKFFSDNNQVMTQLYRKTSGPSSDLTLLTNRVTQNEADIAALEARSVLPVVTTAANYTTTGSVFVNATASLTVTLDLTPTDGDRVRVQPTGNFTVTVSGTINGSSSVVMRGAYDSMTVVYYSDLSGWRIV